MVTMLPVEWIAVAFQSQYPLNIRVTLFHDESKIRYKKLT